jgi:hypothetical protein
VGLSYEDTTAVQGVDYRYRVVAFNAAGESASAPAGGPPETVPAAPTNVVATLQTGPQVTLTFRDNANNEAFFLVARAMDGLEFVLVATLPARNNTGNVTFVDTAVTTSHSYQYRVAAANSAGPSTAALSNVLTTPAAPAAPSGLDGSAVTSGKKANVTLTWADNSNNETGFTIERATNATFTVGLNQSTVAANAVTVTQTGLYRGVTYFYRIRAFNSGGSSGWSNVFSVVTP